LTENERFSIKNEHSFFHRSSGGSMSHTRTSTLLPTGTWTVDRARSRVEFEVKQFGVATVRGAFDEFEGALELSDDPAEARAHGSVSVTSLDTQHERRDTHLRSPAFFDAERYPRLTFESRKIRGLDAGTLEIAGELTLHGVTRPLTLIAELKPAKDPRDDPRLRLTIGGRLNRCDYGVRPNPILNAVVSEQVTLQLDISAVKEA
jgi:polyisoprenoid-binding protein YceI